ncbi:uncharacterized protein [Palaemon carinicauda]|uniref:uncharacterized protein n=1 Tax=Palaemon carinicauda TaxID=392227 RepID=UPI0035B69011
MAESQVTPSKVVRCRMTACAAVLQQPCGHEVCRSHADCGIQMDDLIVWYPDYDLVTTLSSESSSQAAKTTARATLKVWVGGFARNVKAKKPYVLSEEYCNLIYPNAKSSAAVPKEVAAPIIADITATLGLALDQDTDLGDDPDPIEDNVASLNLDLEPMVLDEPVTGFDANCESTPRSHPVPPKVKSQKRPLVRTRKNPTLPKTTKPKKASLPGAPSCLASTSSTSQDLGVQPTSSVAPANFDPVALTNMMSRVVSEQISSMLSAVTKRLDTLEG